MKTKTKVLIGAAAVTAIVGLAAATPIVKLASPFLGSGDHDAWFNVHGVAKMSNGNYYNIDLKTVGPSTVATQIGAYNPGGVNGWHAHPGMVIVTLTKGSIDWYDANCNLTVYNAGDSWMEGSEVHSFRVKGAASVQLLATFVIAKGEAYRIDESAPACAAALGLS